MISILLITFIILMVMSRNFDIDLDIKGLESFNPINMEEEIEVSEVKEDCYSGHFQTKRIPIRKKVKRTIDVNIELTSSELKDEKEEEVIIDDCFSDYFQVKRLLTFEEAFDKMQRKYSKRGKHGHKGYTRVQTLAYKKAREFKTAHLNEWC